MQALLPVLCLLAVSEAGLLGAGQAPGSIILYCIVGLYHTVSYNKGLYSTEVYGGEDNQAGIALLVGKVLTASAT